MSLRAAWVCLGLIFISVSLAAQAKDASDALIVERSAIDLQREMAAGRLNAETLVKAYLARIARIDKAGPMLHSIIAINPSALADARALDAERKAGKVRSGLHGIPILVKDNIETLDRMPTTAGSLALADNFTYRDAPLIARLRQAGAIILAKANLSEWANIRSSRSISGWSAVGGLVKNPNVLNRSACGSSAGTGAGIAASLAAIGIGTETDGSIVCPSSANGLVGLKPTVGLVSRTHVIPISHSQDGAGPMARSVADAALMLGLMAGSDPADPATKEADQRGGDFTQGLDQASLKGKRLGILRYATGRNPAVDALFDKSLAMMRGQGAEIVDLPAFKLPPSLGEHEFFVLLTELKADMNAYLATTPSSVTTRTLADLISFHKASPRETTLFGVDTFERAQATNGLDDPAYLAALEAGRRMTRADGVDKLIADHQLDALIAPTMTFAWSVDIANGDFPSGGVSRIAAVAGYPHLTVPMGYHFGVPVGLSFIGPAWSERRLLGLGYAFERQAKARKAPDYLPSADSHPDAHALLAP